MLDALSLLDISVAVAVIIKSKDISSVTVMVRSAKSSAPSDQVPSALSVPLERVAPTGTPAIVIESASEPSISTRDAEIATGIAVPSSPAASWAVRFGASATAFTATSIVTGPTLIGAALLSPSSVTV